MFSHIDVVEDKNSASAQCISYMSQTAILDAQNGQLRNRFDDRRDVWFYGAVSAELRFVPYGDTLTAVARNSCVSYAFLY